MNVVIVFMLVVVVFMGMILFFCYEVSKAIKRYVSVMTGTTTDKAVDEFFRKAVIIAVEGFKNDKATGRELEEKIIERSCAIMTDVLLQHGLSPRQYNLEGLVKVTMAKLGLISLRGEVRKNGES